MGTTADIINNEINRIQSTAEVVDFDLLISTIDNARNDKDVKILVQYNSQDAKISVYTSCDPEDIIFERESYSLLINNHHEFIKIPRPLTYLYFEGAAAADKYHIIVGSHLVTIKFIYPDTWDES